TGIIVAFDCSAVDNCSLFDFSCVPPSGSFFPVGTTIVTCTAFDDYFNDSQCSFEVTVTQAPCNDRPEDVNCDGVVDVLDVVKTVNVAFRGAAASDRCCHEEP
ncbi:MAG TPA: HYR domain-containing protein, partial [Acidobacteriota bacterium]|nr:HYR domain-containing protein [Acidobacteriota bacterium]